MTDKPIFTDERTVAAQNASYRWAYLFLSFGMLLSAAYRSFVWHEQPWDLLALVVAGGFVATLYQASQRVLSRRWAMTTVATMIVAGVVAAIMRARPTNTRRASSFTMRSR